MFTFTGFRDGHSHPLFAMRESEGPNLDDCRSQQQIVKRLTAYLGANPGTEWLDCGSFTPELQEESPLLATTLDQASSTVPIVVHAVDHHSIWVNSAALAVAGLQSTPPSVVGGSIDVDGDGRPTGVLREWNAMNLIYVHQPKPTIESDISSIEAAQERMLSNGIVAAQDAWIDRGMEAPYLEVAAKDRLKMRFNLAVRIDPQQWRDDLNFAKATRSAVRDVSNPLLTANTVKIFIDGVIGSQTALLAAPYCDGHEATALWLPEQLAEFCLAADSAGFQLHFHAIGDLAVSMALDAVAHVDLCNGWVDRRPVIAHADLIGSSDLQRIRQLGVVVCQQPSWAADGTELADARARIGHQRAASMYPLRDLIESRIALSFGSDWPVSPPEPLEGIYTATTRRNAADIGKSTDQGPQALHGPDQTIDRASAIRAYSVGTAYQLGQDAQLQQDRVDFDTDLLTCTDAQLLQAKVLGVTVAGRQVWTRK